MNRNERMNLFTMFSSILSKKYTQFAKKCYLMLSVQSELHSNMKPCSWKKCTLRKCQ